MGKIKIIISIVILAVILNFLHKIFKDGQLKDIPEGFYGPLKSQSLPDDPKIYPFQINVPDKILQDLKSRLSAELKEDRFTEPLEGIGFQYGTNTKYLKTVLTHWNTKYDWKAREKLLNKYPQFKTKISGLDIHFQHVKGQSEDKDGKKYKETKPIILLHGWPGSFVEFQKVIPLLTQPDNSDINFDVIVPSLAGYGFSDGASQPGLGATEMARLFTVLMKRLGYDKFYVQGGDWGSFITANMATRYPENVLGIHLNLCMNLHPRGVLRMIAVSLFPSVFLTQKEIDRFLPFSEKLKLLVRESGYFHIQATKPDTLGVALSQSPGGLAAYILEKISTGTNLKGVDAEDGLIPQSKFSLDELLDNIMVYWVTNSKTTAMRFYAESVSPREFSYGLAKIPVQVPTGCLQTMDALISQGEWMLRDKYSNIVHYNMVDKGGHFMAMEEPEILAEDIVQFVRNLV